MLQVSPLSVRSGFPGASSIRRSPTSTPPRWTTTLPPPPISTWPSFRPCAKSPLLAGLTTADLRPELFDKVRRLIVRTNLIDAYDSPLLKQNLLERTMPDKPTSRLQKYRLSEMDPLS